MFKFFKKKKELDIDPATRSLAESFLKPMACAAALAEAVRDYTKSVKDGSQSYPAHKRKNPNVKEMWEHIRIEGFHKMFNFGQADLAILADHKQQQEVINTFLQEKPHLRMPYPSGSQVDQTLQALMQVYSYLNKVGDEVMDSETSSFDLKNKGKDILSDLESRIKELQKQWLEFHEKLQAGKGGFDNLPKTFLEAFFDDVTAKSKSIALSVVFGPTPKATIKYLEDQLAKTGASEKDLESYRKNIASVFSATDPEDISFRK
jgi:hypothetical protein